MDSDNHFIKSQLLKSCFYFFFFLFYTSLSMSAQVVKKTQPSRKGKKAWRKNVDISDVTEGQEELRAVERFM